MSRVPAALVIASATLLAGACVLPAPDDGAYRQGASQTVQSASSAVATAQLALESWLHGKLLTPSADVTVTDAEKTLGDVDSQFGGVDPPTHPAEQLRADVTKVLGDAQDAASSARIALRHSDRAGASAANADLEAAAKELDDLAGRLG